MKATGAVLAGRRTAEQIDHRGGDTHGVPIFVPSHRPPGPSVSNYPLVTYVIDGIASAMAQAKAAARDRNVYVLGAYTAQQALEAGLLDEVQIHQVPVLFGRGRRLFEVLPSRVELEIVRVIDTPEATHIRLRPNGAGKTTTLILSGLVRPDAGAIRLFGEDPLHDLIRAPRGVAGFIEEPRLCPHLTGRANIDLLAFYDRGGERRATIDEVLDVVGPRDRAEDRVGEYSQRLRQRLRIASLARASAPQAVFVGRWAAGLRIAAAWLTGISRMPCHIFVFWNELGGIARATAVGLLAYYLGPTAERVSRSPALGHGAPVQLAF